MEELDNFFFNLSKDYIKENLSQIYYLKEDQTDNIIGYFAVSCSDVKFRKELSIAKRVEFIPCTLIGRLAIDKNYQGKGYGSDLIRIALNICNTISEMIGCRLVSVDARAELNIINFYKKFDFEFFKSIEGLKIEKALQKNHKPATPTILMIFDLCRIKN